MYSFEMFNLTYGRDVSSFLMFMMLLNVIHVLRIYTSFNPKTAFPVYLGCLGVDSLVILEC